MKSILHLKDDTEYQIPLREDDKGTDRAKVGADVETTVPNPEAEAKKETKADVKDQRSLETHKEEVAATQSQDDSTANKKTNEISQKEVNNKEGVNNENAPALDDLEEENPNPEDPSNTENISNDTTTDGVPQADTAKAALDKMKKLASQDGVIHPSLFISNFSEILGLMEHAMQLQVKESGSATKESGSVTKEEASKANEQAETTEKTEIPAEGKQGELNGNNNRS